MDKLKLRYLIREAIENVANITSKFSVGDKVTTVDGDMAKVTMAEHPFYTVELEATGTTKSFSFKDLAPYEGKRNSKNIGRRYPQRRRNRLSWFRISRYK